MVFGETQGWRSFSVGAEGQLCEPASSLIACANLRMNTVHALFAESGSSDAIEYNHAAIAYDLKTQVASLKIVRLAGLSLQIEVPA